jgi:putative ABC transport system permease protein
VRALDRKLLRDLGRARGQVITTALVVAGGVAAFVTLMGTYRALRDGQAAYYERNGFPHVFAAVKRAPESEAERLRDLPDVAQVQTRLAFDGRFDLPGLPEPAYGRVVSLPPEGEPGLPAVTLVRGRFPEAGRRGEALVLESFALGHKLEPGARVVAIVEGKRLDLEVTGVAISPEFVMAVGAGGFYAPRRFAVFWLPRPSLADDLGMAGAWNDVTLRLRPGASEEEVIAAVDRALARWGGFGAHNRRDQMSHRALDNELDQLEGLALRIPLIFLLVQAFLLHVILGRFVRSQREQIASLKALGYGNVAIGRHYLRFALAIVLLGCAAGTLFGLWGGRAFLGLYAQYFRLPVLELRLDVGLLGTALLVAGASAIFGALRSVRAAARLAPAEAMRPPAPAVYRRGLLSRLARWRLLSHTGRITARELERRPGRALLSSLGIAMGLAILIVGRFQYDALDWYIDTELTRGMPADAIVALSRPVSAASVEELRGLPGVLAVEAARDVPVRISLGHRARRVSLSARSPDAGLRKIMQLDGSEAAIALRGVTLGRSLADVLRAEVGDRLLIERLEGDRRVLEQPVSAIVEDLSGNIAYVDAAHLHTLLGEERAATTAFVALDPGRLDEAGAALRASPIVMTVVTRRAILDGFQAATGQSMGMMTIIVVAFGSILAIGITYNNARIAIAERGRDLATLRVIGFTREEVSAILLGELAVHLIVAIPLGLALGHVLSSAVLATIDPELYRFPLVIYPRTYAFAVLTVIGAGVLSALLARRKLDKLDLTEALKARD